MQFAVCTTFPFYFKLWTHSVPPPTPNPHSAKLLIQFYLLGKYLKLFEQEICEQFSQNTDGVWTPEWGREKMNFELLVKRRKNVIMKRSFLWKIAINIVCDRIDLNDSRFSLKYLNAASFISFCELFYFQWRITASINCFTLHCLEMQKYLCRNQFK